MLDPAKVVRSGLTNACSIAGIMLTTQVRLVLLLMYCAGVVEMYALQYGCV